MIEYINNNIVQCQNTGFREDILCSVRMEIVMRQIL